MGTLCEKILAKHSHKETVLPGEYIVLKEFVGPVGYSFTGYNFPKMIRDRLSSIGYNRISNPENCILNGDHNIPPQSIDDIELFKSSRAIAEQLGITHIYDRGEGIGHVVNVEKGHVIPGKVFVNQDPLSTNAGGIGALFTNGGRLGGTLFEAFALGQITVCVPGTIKIEINGELGHNVMARDIWFQVLNDLGPDGAHCMVLEFAGSAIQAMCIEERMLLCGGAENTGADGAMIASDAKTQEWFKKNFDIKVETIQGDEDAVYARVLKYNAADFLPMVTYPPKIYTSRPARELSHIQVDLCLMGTCAGGSFNDILMAARILKGKKIHKNVRFILSPVTRRVYVEAAREGLFTILSDAGVMILPPTCDVCLGVKAPLAPGEVSLSQQTVNTPGRSGSPQADIYLASAATIAASSLTGCITDPQAI